MIPFPYARDYIVMMDSQGMIPFPYAKDVIIVMDPLRLGSISYEVMSSYL